MKRININDGPDQNSAFTVEASQNPEMEPASKCDLWNKEPVKDLIMKLR